MKNELVTIGWKERIALPEWGIRSIIAKVDTGASVSAIHVDSVEELPGDRVRFVVALKRDASKTRVVEAPIARTARIKPSHGVAQERYVVTTTAVFGGIEREIEISLVCRKKMRRRMLLGRKAMVGVFQVDPSAAYLLGPPGAPARASKKSKNEQSATESNQ